MKISRNEILFIYNSQELSDRQALGFIRSLPKFKIKEIDLKLEKFTELQIKQLADMLNIAPEGLIDKSSDLYRSAYASLSLSESDVIKAMSQSPSLIKTPIAVYHNHAENIGSPYQIVKWDIDGFPSIEDWNS